MLTFYYHFCWNFLPLKFIQINTRIVHVQCTHVEIADVTICKRLKHWNFKYSKLIKSDFVWWSIFVNRYRLRQNIFYFISAKFIMDIYNWSTGDAYSSLDSDPTSDMSRGPCLLIIWVVILVRFMRRATVSYRWHFMSEKTF
jgi:hypothetical protein